MKLQARRAAADLLTYREYYAGRAKAAEELTSVKLPGLGKVGIKGESVQSRELKKVAESFGTLSGEAAGLGR